MSGKAIELRNVTVGFGKSIILRNVNLEVDYGETLVMVGPSGEGKTVLLKAMAGLYQPLEGEVLIEGRNWQSLSENEKREQFQKIGMLFQKSALFDSIDSIQNICFPIIEHTEIAKNIREEKARKLLDAVGLDQAYNKLPYELSGGMQRRLGIARALALDPAILFYDDPTAGLDPVISDRIVKLIAKLKIEFNSTLVAVTNDLVSAFELADRLVMVAGQEVFPMGTSKEAQANPDPRIQQFINGELEGPLKPVSI